MSATTVGLATFGPALLGALVAMMCDAFLTRRAAVWAAIIGLVTAAGASVWAAATLPEALAFDALKVGGAFSSVTAVITLLAAAALFGGSHDLSARPFGGTSAALVAFGAVATAALPASNDLVMLLISVETAAICAYALVVGARTQRSHEAAMKYFVQGAVATGFLVFGIATLTGLFDSSGNLTTLRQVLARPAFVFPATAGMVLVLSALAFKIAAAPFHSWAPDAYETAPPDAAAFLAGAGKVGPIFAFALIAFDATQGTLGIRLLLVEATLGVASILIGSVAALRQRSLARMLGYAGIAQAGYALIGAAIFDPARAVFFAATYAIASTGTFLSIAAVRRMRPEWDGSVAGLAGVGKTNPLFSASLVVLLMSLAGIPPLLGFWGKLQVFAGAVVMAGRAFLNVQNPLLGWTYTILAIAGVVGSVVSLGYYGAVMRALYAEPTTSQDPAAEDPSAPSSATHGRAGAMVVLMAVAAFALGALPLIAGMKPLLAPFLGG